MKIFFNIFVCMSMLSAGSLALKCWVCDNVSSNDECMKEGKLLLCQKNERTCYNEVRRGSYGMLITKRCKQAWSCNNNFVQNPRAAWYPSQCNSDAPSSVCRCCCNFDGCNGPELGCRTRLRTNPRMSSCIPMEAPKNGRMTCSSSMFTSPAEVRGRMAMGTECYFSCNEGYSRYGPTTTLCRKRTPSSTAKFNNSPPRCYRNACIKRQAAPSNGFVNCTNSNSVGSVCFFSCNPGFSLSGLSNSTCLNSRLWSNKSPTCTMHQCVPNHISPDNGMVHCSDSNNIGSECRFTCNAGYNLVGQDTSTCFKNTLSGGSVWSAPAPICEPIHCMPQHEPNNGEIICSNGFQIGSECTIACEYGYYVRGSDRNTCNGDENRGPFGRWSSDLGTCQAVLCPLPAVPGNGSLVCSRFTMVESFCTFSCNPGYNLVGSSTMVCEQTLSGNAIWSAQPPICVAIRCNQEHSSIQNGNAFCTNGASAGSTCMFSCEPGFLLQGSSTSYCDFDGLWSAEPPRCEQIECPVLPPLDRGEISCSNGIFSGSTCSFDCDDSKGYHVFPPSRSNATCTDVGSWDNLLPCCARTCPPHAVMDLVLVLDSSSSIGNQSWLVVKKFAKSFVELFELSPESSQIAVLRFNNKVDTNSMILLSDYPSNKSALLNAVSKIPYDGAGTKTGKAVKFVNDVVLTSERGDRPNATNVVVVVTDGRAQDENLLIDASESLREKGTLTYAVGVVPNGKGSLDKSQLRDIAGTSDRVLIAETGFEGLNVELLGQLSSFICENRCASTTMRPII